MNDLESRLDGRLFCVVFGGGFGIVVVTGVFVAVTALFVALTRLFVALTPVFVI
ncbi:hypothetical protein [Viridibacillus arvi]|uniref:hypothetical protein n=1 Tax=Viridibacillus arvi TaxID=263475 RepID=UPI0012EEB423|nr:hypothetical protein [Viridibacillus arvi]